LLQWCQVVLFGSLIPMLLCASLLTKITDAYFYGNASQETLSPGESTSVVRLFMEKIPTFTISTRSKDGR
jgi:hypothetical protein